MTRWSMVIDLDKCVACQGCSIACRFENNTPAVKPSEAEIGRAIRWNDVFPMPVNPTEDTGEYPNVQARYLPRPCMQCENPPCIKVCPVQATFQDDQGLVRQNYNRCIGCRFCTVACPYGVRYFNWYNYPEQENAWPSPLEQQLNPDLTVRTKGVMEKCSFCVQRIEDVRQRAKVENRPVRDGEITTACAQTCPARAIVFGDADDVASRVTARASRGLAEAGVDGIATNRPGWLRTQLAPGA